MCSAHVHFQQLYIIYDRNEAQLDEEMDWCDWCGGYYIDTPEVVQQVCTCMHAQVHAKYMQCRYTYICLIIQTHTGMHACRESANNYLEKVQIVCTYIFTLHEQTFFCFRTKQQFNTTAVWKLLTNHK